MKELKYIKAFKNKGTIKNIFIPTEKQWQSTEKQKLSVTESGEHGILFNNIIQNINNAKEMVCLQSFLIQDTRIIDTLLIAKEKGVKIYIMDSAEARLNNSPFEEDESFATKDYKKMLTEKFKNNFIHRQANNLHAKFILIDPKTNPQGYLFTGNFNKKPFFENPELAVNLSKKQVEELFKVFVYHFWEYTTDEQTATNQFEKVKSTGKFKQPNLKNILVTSPNNKMSNLKDNLLKSVKEAKKEIIFSTFGFDINHELSQEILTKLKSGVKTIVFCRPREKAIKGNIEILVNNGANVYCHPLIHAKSLIIDNNEAFIFSANFEKHGLDTGFEIGIKLNKTQLNDLTKIYTNWQQTFPYKYESEVLISEIDKYFNFGNKGHIEENIIKKAEQKSNNRSIKKVEDLINFFTDIKEPQFSSKKYEVERIAKFNEFKEPYKIQENIGEGVDIIKYERVIQKKTKKKTQKTKQEQAVLLTTSKISTNKGIKKLIDILNDDYVGINIFAKNEK